MAMHVTVAVCTWNRCALLTQTLARMTRLTIPSGVSWEVIVVNNRSTDGTDGAISAFEGRLPIRRLWEGRPGAAHARNCALRSARGDYILWTDDDVLVDEGWVSGYVSAFRRWPEAVVFGGPIEPAFEGRPPEWLNRTLDQIGPVFGRQTFGDQPAALLAANTIGGPYGGNMAMSRVAQLRFPFDPSLGPLHGDYGIGEETDVIRRMLSAGLEGWWTPEPLVHHWIPQGNQTLQHVRKWMEGCGRYEAVRSGRTRAHGKGGWAWLYVRLIGHECAFRLLRHFAPPEMWMTNLVCASLVRGHIRAVTDGSRNLNRAE